VNVLALDTATEALGLALRAGEQVRAELIQAGFRHSETLLPHIHRLLSDADLRPADLDLVVCSLGPGSFTGIRIGLAAANGLAFAARPAGTPLCGVSTLEGLAWRHRRLAFPVAVANVSLRRRLHAGLFLEGRLEGEYLEEEPQELARRLAGHPQLALAGSAAGRLRGLLAALRGEQGLLLDAAPAPADPLGLLEAGLERFRRDGPTADPLPLYLRRSEAEIKRGA
jgi:tRNA threonylcarbamoyladenosine biosynthesis protein TsaB